MTMFINNTIEKIYWKLLPAKMRLKTLKKMANRNKVAKKEFLEKTRKKTLERGWCCHNKPACAYCPWNGKGPYEKFEKIVS